MAKKRVESYNTYLYKVGEEVKKKKKKKEEKKEKKNG